MIITYAPTSILDMEDLASIEYLNEGSYWISHKDQSKGILDFPSNLLYTLHFEFIAKITF